VKLIAQAGTLSPTSAFDPLRSFALRAIGSANIVKVGCRFPRAAIRRLAFHKMDAALSKRRHFRGGADQPLRSSLFLRENDASIAAREADPRVA